MASNLKKDSQTEENMTALDWITLRNDMDEADPVETWTTKFARKFNENPFVPIGCGATVLALSIGLYTLSTGNRKMSQYMMRSRIAAQGLTIAALVGGLLIGATKLK